MQPWVTCLTSLNLISSFTDNLKFSILPSLPVPLVSSGLGLLPLKDLALAFSALVCSILALKLNCLLLDFLKQTLAQSVTVHGRLR